MPTVFRMSLAARWPMPWIYWSAISTRLLVGMLTPAIRATVLDLLVQAHGKTRKPPALNGTGVWRVNVRPFAEVGRYRQVSDSVNGFGTDASFNFNGSAHTATRSLPRAASISPATLSIEAMPSISVRR